MQSEFDCYANDPVVCLCKSNWPFNQRFSKPYIQSKKFAVNFGPKPVTRSVFAKYSPPPGPEGRMPSAKTLRRLALEERDLVWHVGVPGLGEHLLAHLVGEGGAHQVAGLHTI